MKHEHARKLMTKTPLSLYEYGIFVILFIFAMGISPSMPLLSADAPMHMIKISIHAWQTPDFLRIDTLNPTTGDITLYAHQPYLSYVIYGFFMSFVSGLVDKVFIATVISNFIFAISWFGLYVFLRLAIHLNIKHTLTAMLIASTVALAPHRSFIPTYDIFQLGISVVFSWAIIQYETTHKQKYIYALSGVSVLGILIFWNIVFFILVYGGYKIIHSWITSKSYITATLKNPVFWYSFICATVTILQILLILWQAQGHESRYGSASDSLLSHYFNPNGAFSMFNIMRVLGPIFPFLILCGCIFKSVKIPLNTPQKICVYTLFMGIFIQILTVPSVSMGYLYPWMFTLPAVAIIAHKIYINTVAHIHCGILKKLYSMYVYIIGMGYTASVIYIFVYLIPTVGLKPYADTIIHLIDTHPSTVFHINTLPPPKTRIASQDKKISCSPYSSGIIYLSGTKLNLTHYKQGQDIAKIHVYCTDSDTAVFENITTGKKHIVKYPQSYRQQRQFILNLYHTIIK